MIPEKIERVLTESPLTDVYWVGTLVEENGVTRFLRALNNRIYLEFSNHLLRIEGFDGVHGCQIAIDWVSNMSFEFSGYGEPIDQMSEDSYAICSIYEMVSYGTYRTDQGGPYVKELYYYTTVPDKNNPIEVIQGLTMRLTGDIILLFDPLHPDGLQMCVDGQHKYYQNEYIIRHELSEVFRWRRSVSENKQ